MAGAAAIKRKDISRPADAWRNPFMVVLPPLAEGSRGIKKYTMSAATAELQVSVIWSCKPGAPIDSYDVVSCNTRRCISSSFAQLQAIATVCNVHGGPPQMVNSRLIRAGYVCRPPG
jgi:hypothetical protein